ncbi:hypothetical protein M885DRAFT_517227 [Pelagophyceae sp. CCMP2097]|nr:hypothetical protein M885DRAFT_517227 [Pelagophyceae sp. CCMP2097]|mmetsp:Transcript_7844/g.25608  ORF Transcript_7844/g.25608 Transcript_7844/m.25608 type:complete len:474 (+) Transcript_7844:139-1560(+)
MSGMSVASDLGMSVASDLAVALPDLLLGESKRVDNEAARRKWREDEQSLRRQTKQLKAIWREAPRQVNAAAAAFEVAHDGGLDEDELAASYAAVDAPLRRGLAAHHLATTAHSEVWRAVANFAPADADRGVTAALLRGNSSPRAERCSPLEKSRSTAALLRSIAARYLQLVQTSDALVRAAASAAEERSDALLEMHLELLRLRLCISDLAAQLRVADAQLEILKAHEASTGHGIAESIRVSRGGISPWISACLSKFAKKTLKHTNVSLDNRNQAISVLQTSARSRNARKATRALVLKIALEKKRLSAAALRMTTLRRALQARRKLARLKAERQERDAARLRLQAFGRMAPWRAMLLRCRNLDTKTSKDIASRGFRDVHFALVQLERAMGLDARPCGQAEILAATDPEMWLADLASQEAALGGRDVADSILRRLAAAQEGAHPLVETTHNTSIDPVFGKQAGRLFTRSELRPHV